MSSPRKIVPPKFTVVMTHASGRVSWHRTDASMRGSSPASIYVIGQPNMKLASHRGISETLDMLVRKCGAKLTRL